MKHFCSLIGLLICMGLSSAANSLEFSFGKRYLDYGNGAVNLDQVTHISPRIDYFITFSEDDPDGYLDRYANTSPSLIKEQVAIFFDPIQYSDQGYYYFQIKASMWFDDFELSVIDERFLKLPTNQDELAKVYELYGDNFALFLQHLEQHLIAEDILDTVFDEEEKLTAFGYRYYQIIKEIDQLNNSSATGMQRQLTGFHDLYRQIVD